MDNETPTREYKTQREYTAYDKGFDAGWDGEPLSAIPYHRLDEKRTRAWYDGYGDGMRKVESLAKKINKFSQGE